MTKTLPSFVHHLCHRNFQLLRSGCLAVGFIASVISLSAQTATSPSEGEEVLINSAGSSPVIGDEGIGGVTVEITADGEIITTNEPAILGRGADWTVDNSGLLQQEGNASATVQLSEGKFTNQADGNILWQTAEDVSQTEDGAEAVFSSIYIESWTGNATNSGEIRVAGLHDLLVTANDGSLALTALHLGSRSKEEDATALIFTNNEKVSAHLSGAVDTNGVGNKILLTGLHLKDQESIRNSGTIEALFDGDVTELAAGNQLEVVGVRADGGATITNNAGGQITAQIDPTGAVADGAGAAAIGVLSDGQLTLTNAGATSQKDAGSILASNQTSGAATAVSIRFEEELSEESEAEPKRSNITNTGNILAEAGEGGTAIGLLSDGRLTLVNQGSITARGIITDEGDPEDEADDQTAALASSTGVWVKNGDGDVTNRGTITAQDGIAVNLENGGILRNYGKIHGDVFLGADDDATLIIIPDRVIDEIRDPSIEGNVDAGGGTNTLELSAGGTTRGDYDGSFVGFSKLHVRAAQRLWKLTGDQEYDTTDIFAGVLSTTDLLTSDITIHSGGSFASVGSVIGNVDVDGGELAVGEIDDERIALVPPDGGGILTVDGDVTFRNGSFFLVVAGETSLDATGDVTIAPAVEGDENTEPQSAPRLVLMDAEWEEEYLVLTGGSITGEFDGGTQFILLDVRYEDTSAWATKTAHREAIATAGQTSNNRSLARALSRLEPEAGSELEDFYRKFLDQGTFQNFGQLADTMSGEIIASGAAASSFFSRNFRQTIVNTIHHRPDHHDGRFAPPPGSEPKVKKTSGFNLWTRGSGVWGDLDRPDEGGNVDYRMSGLLVGADRVWTPEGRAGIAFGYANSRVSRDADRVDGDVFQTALYATRRGNGFIFDGTLGFGFHDLQSKRLVQPTTEMATADYSAVEAFGSLQATMLLEEEGVLILPLFGVDFSRFQQGSFDESGPTGLSGDKADLNSMRAFVGIRMMLEYITARDGLVVPEIRFRYSHELLDRDTSFSAGFRNDPGANRFTTTGASMSQNEVQLGLGVMVRPGRWEDLSIFADYDLTLQHQHLLSAGLSYRF